MKTKYFLFPLAFFLFLLQTKSSAQTCHLFFSEYIEGSSNNKALEIYNPSIYSMSLSNYKVYRYTNGSPTANDSVRLNGTLAGGAIYVIGNPLAAISITSVSDTLHNVTTFNGDDALALINISTGDTLDIIGIIGVDPGTNWPVGTGATSEFTMVRMGSISGGTTNWTLSSTQWDVYPQNTTTFLGGHSGTMCCATSYGTMNDTACDSYTSPSGKYTWATSGTYNDTIKNFAGCDSVITIHLIIHQSTITTINTSACDSLVWQGLTLTSTGTYLDTVQTIHGCDSVLTLNLIINKSLLDTINVTACNSYTWGNSVLLTSSGTYIDTLISGGGCDSVVVLNLTINQNTFYTFSDTTCFSYSWMGNALTISGVYIDTVTNHLGCDSIITLNLTVIQINATITNSGAVLTSNQAGAAYQWINCNGNLPITGTTSQSYTVTANGSYAVIVTLNGCVDTSVCSNVNNIGIQDNSLSYSFDVYPNPSYDLVYLKSSSSESIKSFVIIDVTGREVMIVPTKIKSNTYVLALSSFENGMYFINAIFDTGVVVSKRIVKQ